MPVATISTMIVARALTSGVTPKRTLEKMTIGNVLEPGPATNCVMTRSSQDRVNASSHPEAIAGRMSGKVMRKNTRNGRAPRSMAASSSASSNPLRRDCTTTLTYAMQKVMWASVMVTAPTPFGWPKGVGAVTITLAHITLKWYVALMSNEQILRAAWLSIRIALISASAAVVLGTLAGMALARLGAFRGRMLLAGMTTAPIVMPEVITGLSLLLLFVAMQQLIGWPEGVGAVTITLAHITFCMAYVSVVVQSRLSGFDEALEEAAMDLGARPLRVFFRITLPLILPAIASGWLLAFTLSWDDLVITQFVAGPGSSTLPMVIFSKVRFGVTPDVNALATIMVLIVATGIAISTAWMRYRQQRRGRDLQLAAAANL